MDAQVAVAIIGAATALVAVVASIFTRVLDYRQDAEIRVGLGGIELKLSEAEDRLAESAKELSEATEPDDRHEGRDEMPGRDEQRWEELRRALAARERDVAELRSTLAESDSSALFTTEARNAKYASRASFLTGLVVVAAVIVVGVFEWVGNDAQNEISTGAGIARFGVIAASFYMGGQLFRRSTTLQIRSQELERAAVALRRAKGFARDLSSDAARDQFLAAIYVAHLTGGAGTDAEATGPVVEPAITALLDSVRKPKA